MWEFHDVSLKHHLGTERWLINGKETSVYCNNGKKELSSVIVTAMEYVSAGCKTIYYPLQDEWIDKRCH